jgi:hypothetical protein
VIHFPNSYRRQNLSQQQDFDSHVRDSSRLKNFQVQTLKEVENILGAN